MPLVKDTDLLGMCPRASSPMRPQGAEGLSRESPNATASCPKIAHTHAQDVPGGEPLRESMYQTIAFLGFLSKFSIPQVRSNFLAGAFQVSPHSERMLRSIDKIAGIMLPYPEGSSEGGRSGIVMAAVIFFDKITYKDTDEPLDCQGNRLPVCMPFADWFGYLGTLSRSPYWRGETTDVHIDDVLRPSSLAEGCSRSKGKTSTAVRCSTEQAIRQDNSVRADQEPPSLGYNRKEQHIKGDPGNPRKSNRGFREYGGHSKDWTDPVCNQGKQAGCKPKEKTRYGYHGRRSPRPEVDISGTSSDDDSEDSADGYYGERPGRAIGSDLYHALENIRQPRDVVPPDVFNGSEGFSMRRFLEEYEQYFSIKYKGSEKQKAKLLEKFLDGHVLRAYKAVGGARMRFDDLKPKLLRWYRSERPNLRHQAELDFEKAKIESEDTLHIYAMRLERLADRAYPDSGRDQERKLCRKFKNTVPRNFYRSMMESERNLGLMGGQRELKWSDMMLLAESEDRLQRNQRSESSASTHVELDCDPSVWFSRPAPRSYNQVEGTAETKTEDSKPEHGGARPKYGNTIFHNSNRSPVRENKPFDSPRRTLPYCHWCGRCGHLEASCWNKAGSCLICGSVNHYKDGCPNFESGWRNFNPICSNCGGPHIGRDCRSQHVSN